MYEFRSFKLQLLYDTSSWNGWEGAEKQNKTKVAEDIRIFRNAFLDFEHLLKKNNNNKTTNKLTTVCCIKY